MPEIVTPPQNEAPSTTATAATSQSHSPAQLFPQTRVLIPVLTLLGVCLVGAGVLFRMNPELISPPVAGLLPTQDTVQPDQKPSKQAPKIEDSAATPEPSPVPTQFRYSKTVGSNQYILSLKENLPTLTILRDGETVFPTYSAGDRLQMQLTRFISASTQDFWLDEPSMTFFTIHTLGHPEALDATSVLVKTTLSEPATALLADWEGGVADTTTLQTYSSNWYTHDQILTYLPDASQLLINTSGGDGCGGQGTVWSVTTNTGVRKDILEYGMGCAVPEKSRYGGMLEGQLVVAKTTGEERSDEEVLVQGKPWEIVSELYLLDPITLTQRAIAIDQRFLEHLSLSSRDNWNRVVTAPESADPAAQNRQVVDSVLGPQELLFSGKHPDFPESKSTDYFAYNYTTQSWRHLITRQ